MKNTKIFFASLMLLPLMNACSGDSNALKDYDGIKGEAPTDKKPTIQAVANNQADSYFNFQVNEADSVNFVNVIQGQPVQAVIRITPTHPGIKSYDAQLVDFPIADGPSFQSNQDGTFILKWTPALGTVPKGAGSKKFKATVQVSVKDATSEDLKVIVKNYYFLIEVRENSSEPSIESQSKLDILEEGVPAKIEVVVDDPGTAIDTVGSPEIVINSFPYANKEAFRADGQPYVFQDGVEKLSGTKWKFTLTIYAESLPLGRDRLGHEIPSSETVPVCFYMRALSVTERLSGKKEVCFTGKYAAQPPTMALADGTPSEVKAGTQNIFTLKLSTPNPKSLLSVKNAAKQIANLSGTKTIECSNDSANQSNAQTCTVTWTPACVKAAVKTTLKITADATLNSKVKSSVLTKDLTVLPNPEACTGGRR